MKTVKGHVPSVLLLPKLQSLCLTMRKHQANPNHRTFYKVCDQQDCTRHAVEGTWFRAAGDAPRGRTHGCGEILPPELLLWLFLSPGSCLTGAGGPVGKVKAATEKHRCAGLRSCVADTSTMSFKEEETEVRSNCQMRNMSRCW